MKKLIVFLVSMAFMSGLAGAEPYIIIKKPVAKEHQNSIIRKPIIKEYQPFIDKHHDNFEPETKTQIYRIYADGGVVIDFHYMNRVIRKMKSQGIYSSCKFLADANFGVKKNATTGAVSKLYDISGNNNDAVQTTGANQPVWTANQQNGRAGLVFNGSNSYLSLGNPDTLAISTNATILAVIKRSAIGANHMLFAGGANDLGFLVDANNLVAETKIGVDAAYSTGTINTNGHLIALTYDGINIRFFIDSATDAAPAYTSIFTQSAKAIGVRADNLTYPFNGGIMSLLLFNTTISTAQRQALESLINTYYTIY